MRIAYADPPYPRQARKHYSHDEKCAEVDHEKLIRRLMRDFDGWALSSSADLYSMKYIIPLLPEKTRVCSWVKPFASFKPNVTLAYAWEPVYIYPARKRSRELPTVRDWVAANITLQKGLSGAKPPAVCRWLFEAIGCEKDDSFEDLFPGTNVVGREWKIFSNTAEQPVLFNMIGDNLCRK